MTDETQATVSPWPPGDGEVASRTRSMEWATTPLGPIEHWPQSLRTALDLVLAMPGPATLLWGPAHVQLYNDAYIAIAQDRHPALLGRPVAEGWPDAYAAVILPLLEAARAGRSTRLTDYPVALRHPDGRIEERVFDTDWLPVRDETGTVAGSLQMLVEVTQRRRAEGALRESEARHRLLVESWAQAVWETDPEGVVVADSPSWLALEWVEDGIARQREEESPTRKGYGRELIERALPYSLGARTRFELSDAGVRCSIDLPLTRAAGRRDRP
jgi:PAS domain-containing protein